MIPSVKTAGRNIPRRFCDDESEYINYSEWNHYNEKEYQTDHKASDSYCEIYITLYTQETERLDNIFIPRAHLQ